MIFFYDEMMLVVFVLFFLNRIVVNIKGIFVGFVVYSSGVILEEIFSLWNFICILEPRAWLVAP